MNVSKLRFYPRTIGYQDSTLPKLFTRYIVKRRNSPNAIDTVRMGSGYFLVDTIETMHLTDSFLHTEESK